MWKAELALSDFVLHAMYTSSKFDGVISIELGAGTGTSVVGALLNTSGCAFEYLIAQTLLDF